MTNPETAPLGGVVKLEWSDPARPNSYCSYDHCFADTPFGRIQIEWKGWKDYPGYTVEFVGEIIPSRGDDIDAAKAAAQADYEARILSALSPVARPSSGEVTEDGFQPDDFAAALSPLLSGHEAIVQAGLSNNFNVIIAAMRRAALSLRSPSHETGGDKAALLRDPRGVACPACKGKGTEVDYVGDYMKPVETGCSMCGGHGKLFPLTALRPTPAESSPATETSEDTGWQPIETAPKDGTRVLLAWGAKARVGYYLDNSNTSRPWEGWKVPSMEEWPGGQPFMWQPLPAIPAAPLSPSEEG